MVFIPRPSKRKTKNKTPKTPKPKSAPKTMKEEVALIKQVMAKVSETKYRSEIIVNGAPYNSQIGNGDIIRLLPKLVQDQGEGRIFERSGMKISPQRLRITSEICLTDVVRSGALVVVYYVLQHKNYKNYSTLSTDINLGNSLLKTGDSTQYQGFNGYVVDSMIPVNNAEYTVLKQGKFLLGKNTGTIQDSTTAGNQPMYGNHTRKVLNFDLPVPKTATYQQDDNVPRTQYYPYGFAPFIVFGYYHQNQTPPDVANQDITVSLRSHLWFDDA